MQMSIFGTVWVIAYQKKRAKPPWPFLVIIVQKTIVLILKHILNMSPQQPKILLQNISFGKKCKNLMPSNYLTIFDTNFMFIAQKENSLIMQF